MKYKRLIYIQTSIDIEVHPGITRVLSGGQEVDVLDVSDISL